MVFFVILFRAQKESSVESKNRHSAKSSGKIKCKRMLKQKSISRSISGLAIQRVVSLICSSNCALKKRPALQCRQGHREAKGLKKFFPD